MTGPIHIFVIRYYKRLITFVCIICSMQEIVYLSNSFCKKDFPNNQAGNFQNKLNKSLTFKTKGKVALSEILYTPGSWDNVRQGNNAIGIEISNYPTYDGVFALKELFVYSIETIAAGQPGYNDVVYAVVRYTNGKQTGFNYVAYYAGVIASAPFQRLIVVIKQTKIDGYTNDTTYAIYDSIYKNDVRDGKIYWHYKLPFDVVLKKSTKYNIKSVWIMNFEPKYIGTPVRTTKFLPLRNYEDVNTFLEILTENCNDALEELLKEHAIPRILEWPYPSIFTWPNNDAKKKNWLIIFYNDIQLVQDVKRKAGEGRVRLGTASDYPVKVKITLPSSIAYMLGLTEHLNLPGKYWDNNHSHNTTAKYRKISYNIWEAETTPNLKRNTLRSICLFSDIIDSNFVGDMQMPLMRMLPIDSTTNQIPASFFIIQTYFNVNKINVETIKIWITEQLDGEPILFNSDIFIKLVFDNV